MMTLRLLSLQRMRLSMDNGPIFSDLDSIHISSPAVQELRGYLFQTAATSASSHFFEMQIENLLDVISPKRFIFFGRWLQSVKIHRESKYPTAPVKAELG